MEWFIEFVVNNRSAITAFLIGYLPTIMFALMVVSAILVASIRGIRKTRISIIHSLIAFSICLTLFLLLVDNKNVDAFILNVTNSIVGPNGMQRMFGVSENCQSFREIFIEFIPKQMNFVDGLSIILKENGKYLSSLVDVAYRLTFGIVLYVLFWVLKFILWIIYLIFYNEKKYIRKREAKYENGIVDTPYRKKRLLSAFVGCGRGVLSGLISLSFLGMALYIFAGGAGDGKKNEPLVTNNPDINYALDAYSELETYGTKGIYKILNSIRDEKNMPYYLFAANMIYKGKVEDVSGTTNVYLIEELASYVNFSKNTLNLFIKYDRDNLIKLINNEDNIVLLDDIIRVMNDENFQKEFDELIKTFESKTYFINLTYSLIDSLSKHLTEVSFTKDMPIEVLTPLRILFEEGYLCDEIPYENKLSLDKYMNINTPSYNENDYILGYIKPSNILEKGDIFNLYKIFERVFTNIYNTENEPVDNVLNGISEAIPYLKNLSIMNTDRGKELDGVLKRIYAYLEVKYLGGESDLVYKSENNYSDSAYASISWVDELSMLVDVLDSGLNIYRTDFTDQTKILDSILGLFSPNNTNADKVINAITSSRLIGELFGTKFFQEGYDNVIKGIIDIASFPEGMSFGNVYDNDGHFVDYGEFYYLAKGLKSMMSTPDAKSFIDSIANNTIGNDPLDFLTKISNIMGTKVDNETVGDIVSNSRIINSILSGFLIQNSQFDGLVIYIDDSILEKSSTGETLNIITKTELKTLFSYFPTFIDVATPLIKNQGMTPEEFQKELIAIIKNEKVMDMLDSKIIEGTVSYLAANNIEGTVIIPKSMKDGYDLVSVDNHISEIKKLLTIINDKDINIDIDALINDNIDAEAGTKLLETFINISENKIDDVLSSNILYYTISNFLNESGDRIEGAMSIIVPDIANEALEEDTIDKVIKKDILKDFVKNIRIIISTESVDTLEMFSRIIKNKDIMDNMIISVTTANLLANNLDEFKSLKDVLIIPTKYNNENYGKIDKLKQEFSRTNPWFLEAKALVNALNLVLDLKDDETLNPDDLAETIVAQINTLNDEVNGTKETKLDKLYDSEIFVSTLSTNISKSLKENGVVNEEQMANAKIKGTNNFKKSEIRSLVNAFKLFEIDVENPNIGTIITEDVENNFIYYTEKLNEYNNKSKLDLLYESTIIRDLFTSNINKALITGKLGDSESLRLCYDKDNYFKQSEIESLIYLMKKLGIDNFGEIDVNVISQNIYNIEEDDINYLYRYNITSVLLYGALNGTNTIYISQDAKVKINETTYEAINKNEATALAYLLSNFDINIDDFSIDDVDLNEIDIDKIKDSVIISSIFYTNISKVKEIVIPKNVLNVSIDDKVYIKSNEFGKFLKAIYDNKNVLFSDGYISFDSINLDLESEEYTNDVIISLCDSSILSSTIVVQLLNYFNNIPERYKTEGTKEKMEQDINNVWVKNNEMLKLAYAFDALNLDPTKGTDDLATCFNPTNLNEPYDEDETRFDKCYDSNIAKYLISNEIYNGIDDSLLELSVKEYSYIYDKEDKVYNKAEVKGILDVLNLLSINLEDLKKDGIDENTIRNNVNNDLMYNSFIIKGILTKKIHDLVEANNDLYDCKLCFETFVPVYKRNEIEALFDLVKDNTDLSKFDPNSIKLDDVMDLIYNSSGKTSSYVIVSTISYNIINSGVLVPNIQNAYDSANKIVQPLELKNFINAVKAFGITINGINIEVPENIKMPNADDERLETIAKSYILRAELSRKILINGSGVIVQNDNIYAETASRVKKSSLELNQTLAVVSASELKAIIKSVNILANDSNINEVNIDTTDIFNAITDLDNKEILLSCSAIRVLLGVSPLPPDMSYIRKNLRVINLSNATSYLTNVYVKNEI